MGSASSGGIGAAAAGVVENEALFVDMTAFEDESPEAPEREFLMEGGRGKVCMPLVMFG